MSKFDYIQTLLDENKHWQAKEKLQGRISYTNDYDVDLLEAYGLILNAMGDKIEAGKYLFLSGKQPDVYAEPILLYLKRYTRASTEQLVSTFPKCVYFADESDFPTAVLETLEKRKIDLSKRRKKRPHQAPYNDKLGWKAQFSIYSIIFIFLLFLLVGGYVTLSALVSWLI